MGNLLNFLANMLMKKKKPLPIETISRFSTQPPDFPQGGGFAMGTIDLGGLEVCQVSSFDKIWATHEGGPDNLGATFYEPSSIPEGFFLLGHYSQCNKKPLFGWVLGGRPGASDPSSLARPTGYSLVWTNFTEIVEFDRWIWGLKNEIDPNGLNVYGSRPKDRGVQVMGVSTGSFLVQNSGSADVSLPYCLKNTKNTLLAMPNLVQIKALIEAYSPIIYFHPDEKYLPSSVNWFFQNGALLYQKGLETSPSPVEPDGSNLPQGGSDDGSYWLDLPIDDSAKERVKKGDLDNANAYFHIKPMFGATFTDIAIWVFYPFNGPARAKLEFLTISLGKIGEHVGDWEHLTLTVSNFDGTLKSVYFSEHSGGNGRNGIRNDTAKGKAVMDTGFRAAVVVVDHLTAVEPPWLNYSRKWGPKLSYEIAKEIEKVKKVLPGRLKELFEKVISGVPNEVLGEEGPSGPKMKNNWNGDEKY
ncbi:hypothetical protein L1987_56890 [Smallanthus sonchifolius]|uniref:Uncharacterized protein n=1 Tax=Smallanthus sonchifolius TaxID=185202 RepID=A0ACB9DBR1_9ASTR|nr:hypothetical protein L1987_56890 [Smallanthus sonchifolius]